MISDISCTVFHSGDGWFGITDFILSFKFMRKCLLIHFQTGKGLFYVGITDFIAVFVLEYDMLPLFFPRYRPSSLLHAGYELFPAGRSGDYFQKSYGAICHETLL